MYKQVDKSKNNKSKVLARNFTKNQMGDKTSHLVDNRDKNITQTNIQKFAKSNLSLGLEGLSVVQRNKEEHGLVPPRTHGRSGEFKSPTNPKTTTKGHHHSVPRKQLTRFERMIDRIGRVLATSTNVHVAVALDDNTLVLSANKESDEDSKKLKSVALRLKDTVNGKDPLEEDLRITGGRRTRDLKKMKILLEGKYTDDSSGVETNEETSEQLVRLIKAVNGPVLDEANYHKGNVGIYVVPTSTHEDDRSYNMHGELKVSEAIRHRRRTNKYKEKHVYIGGTLADCFACNASHKLMNEQILKQISHADWGFYSGGTHGGIFPNYKLSDVARDNEARFKELTGTTVTGGIKPHLVESIDPERGNSLNEDSESDAEDVENLTAYAKARKIYIDARNRLRNSKDMLLDIEEEINKASVKHNEMLREVKNLESVDTHSVLYKAIQEMEEAKVEREKLLKQLEVKKNQLDQAGKELEEAENKVKNHSKIKPKIKKGGNAKGGIKVAFKSGRVLHDTTWLQKTDEQRTLDSLEVTKAYTIAYNKQQDIKSELHEMDGVLLGVNVNLEQLEINLKHAKAQYDRKNDLPEHIELVISMLKDLESKKTKQESVIEKDEHAKKTAKIARKEAANDKKTALVRDKQDFINKATIMHDQVD